MSLSRASGGDRTFGRLLRHWRHAGGSSQLGLATDAGVSIRHLSFLETGRARPSRDMVERLAAALGVPLAEKNALLLAAGFAPAYGERPLGAPELAPVRGALEFILRQQEPYPAIVVDGLWDVVMRNEAAKRIFGLFLDSPPLPRADARNALRSTFHPDGLRRFIVNWEELAGPLVHSLHRDAAGDAAVARLRDELLAYPGVPARWRTPDPRATAPPLLTMRLARGDLSFAFFSTITTLATPQDLTLERLRIECFHPADAATAAAAAGLAASAARAPAAIGGPRTSGRNGLLPRAPRR
jgi:transcriptional regulator with XRE-family HTH domain